MGQWGRKNFFRTIAEGVTANANNLKGLSKKPIKKPTTHPKTQNKTKPWKKCQEKKGKQ